MKRFFIVLGFFVFLSSCAKPEPRWQRVSVPTLHFIKQGHVDDWPALFFVVSNPEPRDRDLLIVCWTGDHCHSRDNCVIEPVQVPAKSDVRAHVIVKRGDYTCRLAEKLEHRKKTGWIKCPTDDVKCQPDPLKYDEREKIRVRHHPLQITDY